MADLAPGTNLARGFSEAATSWPLVRASELFELKYGKALVDTSRRPGAVPVFGTNGRCGWHDVALFKAPGVILGRKGQGPLGVEWSDEDYWVIDTAYALAPRSDDVDLRFAYYLVRYVGLNHLKDGTSNPSLSRDTFATQAFPVPPRTEQRRIAAALKLLDDKIELNQRMNETLEAMARALFKSWFIDFDPVRAKMAGRAPFGMDAATATLFPADFGDSAETPLPNGWCSIALDAAARFLNGLALQNFPPAPDGPWLPVLKIAQLRAGSLDGADRASVEIPETHRIKDGDLIFSWSGSLLVRLWAYGPAALNQHLFKVTSETYPRWFIHGWLQHHLPGFQAIAADKATTMGHIQRHHLTAAMIHIPSAPVIRAAGALLEPLEARLLSNEQESRTLAELRDLLLPKLLSGEIRIRDAEKAVEAVL